MKQTRWLAVFLFALLIAAPLAAQWDDGPGEVPYVPTPPQVVEGMLKLGGVTSSDVVYDLGCGDGRIVVMAAQKFGARGTGIDINPVRIKEAEENARQAGVSERVRFIEKNLFDADVHEATLVTLYLLPDVNLRLRPILLRQLKTGSRIVSHAFDMDDWAPDKKVSIDGRTVYLWTVTESAKRQFGEGGGGSPVAGEWIYRMPTPNGELEATLVLKTEGHTLTGTFTFPENRKLEISEGTVDGNQLKFTVRRDRPSGGVMIYKMTGTVEGDQIKGSAETDMDGQPVKIEWSAKRK
jgi:SAM-dependent methyltransferase